MTDGYVEVLPSTMDAFFKLNLPGTDGNRLISCETAAWLVYVLKQLPDEERIFPHGKWGTIQSMEQRLEENAKAEATRIVAGGSE